jgi:hypothetical protein
MRPKSRKYPNTSKTRKIWDNIKRESKEIRRSQERRNGIEEKDGNEMKYGDFISLGNEIR